VGTLYVIIIFSLSSEDLGS